MDIQLIIAILLGLIALVYVGRQMIKQFTQTEKDPKGDNCPLPESRQEAENRRQETENRKQGIGNYD